jgi:hypothetical protein
MMGVAETTGLVVIVVAVIEGLMSLVKYLINKNDQNEKDEKLGRILRETFIIKEKVLHLHGMHAMFDSDGTPMWYVPRSWTETQDRMADRLQDMQQTQLQVLGIIERLERRMENLS